MRVRGATQRRRARRPRSCTVEFVRKIARSSRRRLELRLQRHRGANHAEISLGGCMDEGFQLVEAALHRAIVWEPGSVDREKGPRLVPIGLNDKLRSRRAAAVIRL